MVNRLQYIGKSNRKFTHNHTYIYHGSFGSDIFYMTVHANKNQIIHYTFNHAEYFNDNFKFMDENDYNKLIRKLKLKKINKNG